MLFTTLLVKNVPASWAPVDIHNCFSAYGMVIGTFLYQTLDKSGHQQGLVELGSPHVAREMCTKTGGLIRMDNAVLSLAPTDVTNLAEWLGHADPSVGLLRLKLPPGLGIILSIL